MVHFVLDGLHVQRGLVSATGLFDAHTDFAAQFFVAESAHVFGLAKPAIQLPPVLRGEPFRGDFDFGHSAHGGSITAQKPRVNERHGKLNGFTRSLVFHDSAPLIQPPYRRLQLLRGEHRRGKAETLEVESRKGKEEGKC